MTMAWPALTAAAVRSGGSERGWRAAQLAEKTYATKLACAGREQSAATSGNREPSEGNQKVIRR